jgi:hypothetical protein
VDEQCRQHGHYLLIRSVSNVREDSMWDICITRSLIDESRIMYVPVGRWRCRVSPTWRGICPIRQSSVAGLEAAKRLVSPNLI